MSTWKQANEMGQPTRPVFLDLTRIKLPVGALASIGHRLSGVVLAISVPIAIYLLQLSLRGEAGFSWVQALFTHIPAKLAVVIVVWALAHHVFAGVRHLLSDFDIGSPLRTARRTAWFVNLIGVVLALATAGALL